MAKQLAILLDPDKVDPANIDAIAEKINASPATQIFVGGSLVGYGKTEALVSALKSCSKLPVILFPGNPSQISDKADAILFLSLLSGRNPDFLIQHQVDAAKTLRNSGLQIIPTGYLLIESGSKTAVAKVSQTEPMPLNDPEKIVSTAIASEMLGHKLVYLEAGSGAMNPVPESIISAVSESLNIPLIVGGGIRDLSGIQNAYNAGADLVVIGTAFENDPNFFD